MKRKSTIHGFTWLLAIAVILSMIMCIPNLSTTSQAAPKSYVKSLTVATSASVDVGKKITVKPTVKVVSGASTDVTVKSSSPKTAKVSYSKSTKKITITGVKAGTATITVTTTAKNKSSKKISKTIKVTVKQYVKSLSVASSKTVNVGAKVTVTPSVTVVGNVSKSVTVTSKNTSIATASYSAKTNKITITGKKAGTAKIIVTTSATNSSKKKISKTITVTVKSVAVKNPTVLPTLVTVSANPSKITIGSTTQLNTTVFPSNATDKSVTYTSNHPDIAEVSKTGLVTGKSAGTATITVLTSNGKSEKIDITVTQVEATSVTASADLSTITVGGATVITYEVLPENAVDKSVTFTSADSNIAAVLDNGVVAGINAGETTITVSTSNGKSTTVPIKVTNVEATSITLSSESIELTVSGTTTLKETILPENTTQRTVTWTTSDSNIVSVDQLGTVTARATGDAIITATTTNGLSATCNVHVKSQVVLADGITMEMKNPYTDNAGTTYDNTTLVGDTMTLQTSVVSGGAPQGNVSIRLSMKPLYGSGVDKNTGINASDLFTIQGDNNSTTVKTNDDGTAQFTIGLKDTYANTYNAVSGVYQSYLVTAEETSSHKQATLTVRFACVQINGITVLNGSTIVNEEDNSETVLPSIVPSENANANDTGIKETYYLDSTKTEQYVSSQQVSLDKNGKKEDHSVYFSASPYLILPATSEPTEGGKWEDKDINKSSGSYSVYNDATNETTTVKITSLPKGLQYITLQFAKLDLSAYTTMNIEVRDAETGNLLTSKIVTSESNGSSAIQVEEQLDVDSYLIVSIISQGQVDSSSQGYVLTKLIGKWSSDSIEAFTAVEIPNSVTWTNVSDEVSTETKAWSYTEAVNYLSNATTYLNDTYRYSYMVPIFPYTGDAYIYVKDSTGKELNYFLYPSYNSGTNINILASSSNTINAISSTSEEVTNKVGTLTTNGNMAIVNSTATGMTALKAVVSVAGLDSSELNYRNGQELYTSVQWSPVPNSNKVDYPDYFALEGQTVTVTAKLSDPNGNAMSTDIEGKTISFSYIDNNKKITIDSINSSIGDYVTVSNISNNGATNGDGTVDITFADINKDGYSSRIEGLTASSPGNQYDVSLSFDGGKTFVDAGNIYWVDLGLTFVDNATGSTTNSPVRTTQFGNSTGTIGNSVNYNVSATSKWNVGYQVVARCYKFGFDYQNTLGQELVNIHTSHGDKHKNEFSSVTGVTINYSKDSSAMSLTQANNIATISSTKAPLTAKLTGSLSISDSNTVEFTYYDEDGNIQIAKNIGSGRASINNTALVLSTVWNTTGVNVEIIAPEVVNEKLASKVYVKVIDDYKNPIVGAHVEYSISGINSTGSDKQQANDTNDKGVTVINLPVPTSSELQKQTSSTITFTVNGTITQKCTIYYADSGNAFDILTDTSQMYAVSVGADKKTLNVYFTNQVDEKTIQAKQFTFVEDTLNNTYEVVNAVRGSESNCITLTLDKEISNMTASHTLKISSYTDDFGIEYLLTDNDGSVLKSATYTFKPSERK